MLGCMKKGTMRLCKACKRNFHKKISDTNLLNPVVTNGSCSGFVYNDEKDNR